MILCIDYTSKDQNKGPYSYDGLHHLQRLVNGSVCIKISLRHKFVIENCLQLLSQALCLFLKALLLFLDGQCCLLKLLILPAQIYQTVVYASSCTYAIL